MERLIEALEVIKAECKKSGNDCHKCVFGGEHEEQICKIVDNYPCSWEIEQSNDIERLLK